MISASPPGTDVVSIKSGRAREHVFPAVDLSGTAAHSGVTLAGLDVPHPTTYRCPMKTQNGIISGLLSLLIVLGFTQTTPVVAQPTTLLDPLTQPRFINPLPNPLSPGFIWQPTTPGGNHYEIGIFQFQQNLGLKDPQGNPLLTTLWGYGYANDPASATYPGRTFVINRGANPSQPITLRWLNKLLDNSNNPIPHLLPIDTSVHWALKAYPNWNTLGVPVVTHLHGGHTASLSDGLPDAWYTPNAAVTGRLYNEMYTYDNDQEAATLWYHDHALGITRLNVYAGLAGFYLLRDTNESSLGLPSYPYEVPIVIQDRMFTTDGQLYYPSEPEEEEQPDPSVLPEFFGDVILVNGQAWPFLNVEPRKYRLRMLNGSDSRFYTLILSSGQRFVQIGTDLGLLDSPVELNQLTIGPGERADVIVDFARHAGQTIVMKNRARAPFPKGETVDPRTVGEIMAFVVGTTVTIPDNPIPTTLRPSPITPLQATAAPRQLLLFEGEDGYGRLQPALGTAAAGAKMWDDPITENPSLNDVEVWEVFNTTEDAHPIHLHLVAFQIVDRQKFTAVQDAITGALSDIRLIGRTRPPEINERGWKDTAPMFPGEVTRVIARFDRLGEYVWHCHILSHEDHEMMRPYVVVPPPPPKPASGVLGEDVQSFSLEQNYPNPFNPTTTIAFALPHSASTHNSADLGGSHVTVRVYNMLGQEVATLIDQVLPAGNHTVKLDASNLPSGVYWYRLTSTVVSFTKKMLLVR